MAYKSKKEAPPEVAVLIEAFNAIQSDGFGPSGNERVNDLNRELGEKINSSPPEEWHALQVEYAKLIDEAVPPAIRAAFKFPDAGGATNAMMDIRRLEDERITMFELINAWEETRTQDFALTHGPKYPFHFRPDGTVTSSSRVLEIFSRVPIDHMKWCKICGKFFWAKKTNAETCSPEHAVQWGNKKRSKAVKDREKARAELMNRPPEIW